LLLDHPRQPVADVLFPDRPDGHVGEVGEEAFSAVPLEVLE
jgi:hypothetical protein